MIPSETDGGGDGGGIERAEGWTPIVACSGEETEPAGDSEDEVLPDSLVGIETYLTLGCEAGAAHTW